MTALQHARSRRGNFELIEGGAMNEEAEHHEGSTHWMPIRSGLVDAKHRKAMGTAIWLYLYLHEQATFTKGVIKDYTHEKAAAVLGICERSIVEQMARLVKHGYVTIKQRQHDATVTIARFGRPEDAEVPSSRVAENFHPEPSRVEESCQPQEPRVADFFHEGSRKVHPHPYHESKIHTSPNGEGADAPSPAVEHTPEPARSSRKKRAPKVVPPTPEVTLESLEATEPAMAKVVVAWLAANYIRPQTAGPDTLQDYSAKVQALLDRGHAPDHLVGCLRWLVKGRKETGKSWRVTPQMLAERVGQWQEAQGCYGVAEESRPGGGPPWPPYPPGNIHDPDTAAGRRRFVEHYGISPYQMSREQAVAAGVLDVFERKRS